MPWPEWTYNVQRAEFDTILLDHARKQGVHVVQPATVQAGGVRRRRRVTLEAEADGERVTHRARFLVDASGRDSFLAARVGPAHARAQSRQGRAVRVLPRRRSLPGPGGGQRPHLPLRRRLVLVDPALARPDQHRRGPARPDRARVRRVAGRALRAHGRSAADKVRDHLGSGRAHDAGLPHRELLVHQRAGGRRSLPARGRRRGLRGSDLLQRRLHRHSHRASWPPRRS